MIGVNQFKLLDEDIKAVARAVKTGWISSAGPEILKFEQKFSKLIERKEFMSHPILPLVADFAIELGMIEKKSVDKELKSKIETQIKKKREYIKSVLKEPAYRFNDKFALEK